MSSSWNGGVAGMICPTCTRAHFPFCGARDPPGHMGFPPYGHGPMPMAPLHNFQQPMAPNVGFNRPLSPLGRPHHGRHEGFFEQNHDHMAPPNFNPMPRLGHPLPLPHDTHAVVLGGGHMGPSNNWSVEEDWERERRRQWEREKWGMDQQRKDLVQQHDRSGSQGLGVERLPIDSIPSNFQRSNQQSGFYSGMRETNELGMEGHGRSDDYHNYRARFEGFEGGLRGTNVPFKHVGEMTMRRLNEGLDFEHNVQVNNRDSGTGMEMSNEYRNFHPIQSEFGQGSSKRARMDGEDDGQGPRDGRVFGSNMERAANRFLGHQNPHHPGASHNVMQSLNNFSGDRVNTCEREQMKKDVSMSNKRKQMMSREEELLIEHGLLDDSPDGTDNGPYKSESLFKDKALSQESKQGFGFPLDNVGNDDDVRLLKTAPDANAFSQKFHPAIAEGTYQDNALDKGYSFNPSRDNFHSSTYIEARDQNRDVPLHLQGSQKNSPQRRSMESGRFWHDKHNDRNSVLDDKTRTPEGGRSTFHATRDGVYMPIQQAAGGPFIPGGGGVHQPDSNKGGFGEHHHSSGGNAIQQFRQSRTQSMKERQKDESLKTIEELHMDFVQQQQQKNRNQSHFQAAHFQEETSRRDEGTDVFLHARQQHSQSVGRNEIEVLREESKQYNRDQTNYNQIQQLQTIHLGEPNSTQDQIEFESRTGDSVTDSYGDRVHHSNVRAQHHWSQVQPLQHQNSQSDFGLMNSYPSTHAHNYEAFQRPPSHHMVQEHNLQIHEQQQRLRQPEHPKTNLHGNCSQLQQQELQLMPNQVPQNVQPNQQSQLKRQQNGPSQVPQRQFLPNLQSQEQQSLSSHQLMFEKQHTPEWYQLQQGGNQETGKQYLLEGKVSHHHLHNQQMPQFSQQSDQYQHLDGHQKIPQIEQAEQKSQHIFTGGGPVGPVSQVNMYGGYELQSEPHPNTMQISASIPKGHSLIQIPQVPTVAPPVPPLPPPPLPPSPPSSPAHAPPPPPPSRPASPPKSSASSSFSSAMTGTHPLPTSMRSFPDIKPPTHGYQYPQASIHHGAGFAGVTSQGTHQMPFNQFGEPGHLFPPKPVHEDRPKVVDAINIFNQPGRASRPDRFVIILRGLPGSGKSYLAKALRDVEVASGGSAPRIHSMDDYFMTEVEKDEENDSGSVTSSLLRSKKRITKKVMEYCYEPEMEEAYRTSMLKAFKKTLDEGIFTFIIVDDRNLRVADFAQFWAVAKRSGYEVYLLEAPYKDPAGCAARNVHGFTADKVKEMAKCWEPAPPLYLQLDVSALFRCDDLNAQDITEVEMDTDDTEHDGEHQEVPSKEGLGKTDSPSAFSLENASHGNRWRSETLDARDQAKDLTRSKWSDDHEEDNNSAKEVENIDSNALSGLMQAYGKGDRCVRWADQGGKNSDKGFSIGRLPQNKSSLIIGPGSGYNEASNPLPEEERSNTKHVSSSSGESKRNTKILEQLRAEQESFRAVFDRRRHRIGGMEDDDE